MSLMASKQLIAWSRRRGSRKTALTHLVRHAEATRTVCGMAIIGDWWSIAPRQVGEPSCTVCVAKASGQPRGAET